MAPAPVFLPGKSEGHRRLSGYNPWGGKEWNTTGDVHTHARMHRHG